MGGILTQNCRNLPLLFKGHKVVIHTLCRTDPEVSTDLAQCWWKSLLLDTLYDEVQNGFLSIRQRPY